MLQLRHAHAVHSAPARWSPYARQALTVLAIVALSCQPTLADIDPLSGIDFVHVGAVGNAPWTGSVFPYTNESYGRGAVNYEYHIDRFEVTTAQWAEFFNAAFDRPAAEWLPGLAPQLVWGARAATPTSPGGLRWRVPVGSEMVPVGNISWRTAAMYCNWLCNNKSADRAAFMDGAYDVSRFGGSPQFTDQLTHNAGARYWIPTWDEWIKAAHYDPNRNGPGRGGYWLYRSTACRRASGHRAGELRVSVGTRSLHSTAWGLPTDRYAVGLA